MTFIPTFCDGCSRSTLVQADRIQGATAVCAACGGSARVVPGSSFRREDVAPYEALAKTLNDAAIGPLNADQLSAEIADASYAVPGPMLRHLAKTLPSLAFLEHTAQNGPHAVRKVEGMLTSLLRGIASGRRQSGFIATPARERSRTGG